MKSKIFAIIVTFNPEIIFLRNFLKYCSNEFSKVIVVDNASSNFDLFTENINIENLIFLKNEINVGIGAAQNVGIKYALNNNATHLVFFDQDSNFEPGYLSALLNKYYELQKSGRKISAIGPSLIDSESHNPLPFITYKYGFKRRVIPVKNDVIKCYALLSSGTLVSAKVIMDVGLFDEGFFIAYVDIEWCSRANSLGYSCYGIGSVTLNHSLGDSRFYLGKSVIPMHSPLRHYYVFRNGIFMLKSKHVPIYWKLNDLIQLVRSFLIYLIFGPSKFLRFKMISRGIFDGIFNNKGKLVL